MPQDKVPKPALAFPLSLRSSAIVPHECPPLTKTVPEEEGEEIEDNIDEEPDSGASLEEQLFDYKPLDIRALEKLKMAVSNYGPTVPFTPTLFESMTEGWLTPNEFNQLAQAALSEKSKPKILPMQTLKAGPLKGF